MDARKHTQCQNLSHRRSLEHDRFDHQPCGLCLCIEGPRQSLRSTYLVPRDRLDSFVRKFVYQKLWRSRKTPGMSPTETFSETPLIIYSFEIPFRLDHNRQPRNTRLHNYQTRCMLEQLVELGYKNFISWELKGRQQN